MNTPGPDQPHAEQFQAALAALGRLDPDEEARFRAHAAGCATCTAELAEFGELRGALDVLTPEAVERLEDERATEALRFDLTVLPDDADLDLGVELLVARARRDRRRQLATRAAAGLTAVAAAVLVGVAVTGGFSSDGSQLRLTTALGGGPAAPTAHGSVTVTDDREGSRMTLTATGLPDGEHCTLVVTTTDHRVETVMTWTANYEGEAVLSGPSPVAAAQLDSVEVNDDAGKTLMLGRAAH